MDREREETRMLARSFLGAARPHRPCHLLGGALVCTHTDHDRRVCAGPCGRPRVARPGCADRRHPREHGPTRLLVMMRMRLMMMMKMIPEAILMIIVKLRITVPTRVMMMIMRRTTLVPVVLRLALMPLLLPVLLPVMMTAGKDAGGVRGGAGAEHPHREGRAPVKAGFGRMETEQG
jgi:hypothetical protein